MDDRIGLAEAISAVREELEEARRIGKDQRVQFAVGPVDLEFTVQAIRELSAGAKVRFWVVEAGADGKVGSSSTQLVKVHLEPIDTVTKAAVLVAETEGGTAPTKISPAVG